MWNFNDCNDRSRESDDDRAEEDREADRLIDLLEKSNKVDEGPPRGSITRFLRDRELGVRGTCERFTRQITIVNYCDNLPKYLKLRKIHAAQNAVKSIADLSRSHNGSLRGSIVRFLRDRELGACGTRERIRSAQSAISLEELSRLRHTNYRELDVGDRAFVRRECTFYTRSRPFSFKINIDSTYDWLNYYFAELSKEDCPVHLSFQLGNTGLQGDIFIERSGYWAMKKFIQKYYSGQLDTNTESHYWCYHDPAVCEGCLDNLNEIVYATVICEHREIICKVCE